MKDRTGAIKKVVDMIEGISYFGLTTLFSFDFVTADNKKDAIQQWSQQIDNFSNSLIL